MARMHLASGAFEDLAHSEINGRQIRNLVRLARILHPGGAVTLNETLAILEYGCR